MLTSFTRLSKRTRAELELGALQVGMEAWAKYVAEVTMNQVFIDLIAYKR